jgi:hypothetical protein
MRYELMDFEWAAARGHPSRRAQTRSAGDNGKAVTQGCGRRWILALLRMRSTKHSWLICPTGCSAVRLSSPIFKNISVPARPKSNLYPLPSRPTEGRIAIVTDAGRDAVDADGAKDESAGSRTAKSCGPDASTPASSWREIADDGDKQARSPGRARRKPLKPLCAGMPGDPVRPW